MDQLRTPLLCVKLCHSGFPTHASQRQKLGADFLENELRMNAHSFYFPMCERHPPFFFFFFFCFWFACIFEEKLKPFSSTCLLDVFFVC